MLDVVGLDACCLYTFVKYEYNEIIPFKMVFKTDEMGKKVVNQNLHIFIPTSSRQIYKPLLYSVASPPQESFHSNKKIIEFWCHVKPKTFEKHKMWMLTARKSMRAYA